MPLPFLLSLKPQKPNSLFQREAESDLRMMHAPWFYSARNNFLIVKARKREKQPVCDRLPSNRVFALS
jgi:hypothetical protein